MHLFDKQTLFVLSKEILDNNWPNMYRVVWNRVLYREHILKLLAALTPVRG